MSSVQLEITIHRHQKLIGMIDIDSKELGFHYTDTGTHEGLQHSCQTVEEENILNLACKTIVFMLRQLLNLNSEQNVQASVATDDDSTTDDGQQ